MAELGVATPRPGGAKGVSSNRQIIQKKKILKKEKREPIKNTPKIRELKKLDLIFVHGIIFTKLLGIIYI